MTTDIPFSFMNVEREVEWPKTPACTKYFVILENVCVKASITMNLFICFSTVGGGNHAALVDTLTHKAGTQSAPRWKRIPSTLLKPKTTHSIMNSQKN